MKWECKCIYVSIYLSIYLCNWFFLFKFSDVLLYTSRAPTAQLQFKVHGQLPLQGVMTEETEPKMGVTNCFTIYGGNRALMVAARYSKSIYMLILHGDWVYIQVILTLYYCEDFSYIFCINITYTNFYEVRICVISSDFIIYLIF